MTDEPSEKAPAEDDEFSAKLAELEERAKNLRRGKELADPATLETRLDALESATQKARQSHRRGMGIDEKERRLMREDSRGLGLGLSVGYTIIGLPLCGALLGWAIDAHFGTIVWRGILALVGAVGGIAMALTMLNHNRPGP